jgi:hypothetical protein
MSVWFEGENVIGCDLAKVQRAFDNPGEHYVGVFSLMPGLTSVELVEAGTDFVTIRTNEGLMKRTSISKRIEADRLVVELNEVYEAGSRVTVTGRFSDEFTTSDDGVAHRLVISDVEAPGFLGSLYRTFGGKKMGNALLTAYKAYLET